MRFKDFIEVFNAFLTPLIAIVAVYIAWRQFRTDRHSLRNQLYERRYAVFKAFMSFLADIMREGKSGYTRSVQFYAEASEADFLFSDKIGNKREELYMKAIDLQYAIEQMYPSDGSPGIPKGEERSRVAQSKADLLKWFSEQVKQTKDLFKLEMKIG